MAIRYSILQPHILVQDDLIKKPLHKAFMIHKVRIQTKKSPSLLIRSSIEKVYEDQTRGIVCYKNESGEIICEGYDEGPRFHQQVSRKTYHHHHHHHQRYREVRSTEKVMDVNMLKMLLQCWKRSIGIASKDTVN